MMSEKWTHSYFKPSSSSNKVGNGSVSKQTYYYSYDESSLSSPIKQHVISTSYQSIPTITYYTKDVRQIIKNSERKTKPKQRKSTQKHKTMKLTDFLRDGDADEEEEDELIDEKVRKNRKRKKKRANQGHLVSKSDNFNTKEKNVNDQAKTPANQTGIDDEFISIDKHQPSSIATAITTPKAKSKNVWSLVKWWS